ncbi:MAG: AAA family ATPase [Treponema sp.]|nr:AAA family ATPase [Treponema sp.]
MAHMIPAAPRFHTPADHEDDIFNALKKGLSDEYTVIHSFHSIQRNGKIISDCQSDFLVFHPQKGFLSIEAKYGDHIRYERGEWYFDKETKETHFLDSWSYGKDNEIIMSPFEQADRASKELRKYIKSKFPEIVNKTKFTFGVWFHGMHKDAFNSKNVPEHFNEALLLTRDDLENPEKRISSIFSLDFFENQKTSPLTKEDIKRIFEEIVDPSFIAVSKRNNTDIELDFIKLLEKQQLALNFMDNEKSVTVIGGAGTGKTILAKEHAKSLSKRGEKVLLLCYNWMLCEEIEKEFSSDQNVKVMTVDNFALWMCKQNEEQKLHFTGDFEKKRIYQQAANLIGDMYGKTDDRGFQIPFSHFGITYNHVIIDEAQDLGKNEIEDSSLIENLQTVVLEGSDEGSFIAFYDSLQNIQTSSYGNDPNLPILIKNSFCRIPLKTNCRNTKQIDYLSKEPYLLRKMIKERLYKASTLNEIPGKKPIFYICIKNEDSYLMHCLDSIINSLLSEEKFQKSEIAILTLTTEDKSFIYSHLESKKENAHEKYYYKDILVTSCRKFKGCERKSIILIDFNETSLHDETAINTFYVGTTRAIYNLNIITSITKEQAHSILINDMSIKEKDIKEDDRKVLVKTLGGLCKEVV